jgi:hypothetical protein
MVNRQSSMGNRAGWIAIEAMTAIVLLGVLAASYTMLQRSTAALNEAHLERQRCILAAEAQLDSLTATGQALDPAEVERCWPGVRTEVLRRAGEGAWEGLPLATVSATATVPASGREIRVELSRYLPAEGGRP